MTDPTAAASVASPCIGVCALEPQSGWCEGCLRTIDEIAAWGALDDRARREVWKRLPARRLAREARAGEAQGDAARTGTLE